MTVEAVYLQNLTYSAEQTRRASTGYALRRGATIGSAAGGVVNLAAGDLALSAPGSGLSVNVAPGEALVNGSSTASQGPYYFRSTVSTNVPLAAANPSNPRIDLVCATIEDAAYSGSSNLGLVQALTGTPTAGATLVNLNGAPSLPTSSLLLGYVLVPAGASNIVTADILNDAVQLQGSLALGGAALGANVFTGAQTAPSFIASGSTGATAASNYGGATTSGAPASGTWTKGTYVVDQTGSIWICTTAGTPGTWAQVGSISAAAIESTFTATGQLYVGTGSGGGKLLPVGTAGYVLTSNGTGATGPSWLSPSGLLTRTYYNPAAIVIASTGTTAGAASALDTAHLTVVFTAPSSGAVLVHLTALPDASQSVGEMSLLWCLLTHNTTTRVSDWMVAGHSEGGAQDPPTTEPGGITCAVLVTGLTPGNSYQWDWGHAPSSTTSLRTLYGGTTVGAFTTMAGPAVMEVWVA